MKNLLKVFIIILAFCLIFFSCREPYIGTPTNNNGSKTDPKNDKMPKMADSFVDSIGVCMHVSYWDTNYNSKWDDVVYPRLVESGIRHIRDDLPTWFNGTTTTIDILKEQRFRALAAHGIRLNAVMWARDEDHPGGHRPDHRGPIFTAEQIAGMLLKDNVYEYVVSVEGPNEYNWPGMPYSAPDWVNVLRTYMPNLHSAIKNTPVLSNIDVIGPSLVLEMFWTGPQEERDRRNDNYALGDVSQWVDYGNMHLYPHGNIPSHNVDTETGKMNVCFPGKPYIVTEMGHYTLANGWGLSERADGIHMPRFFLEYFNRGIKRSFKYQFIDEFEIMHDPGDPENYFGLIDRTGRPKPAYYSLKNMIEILKDPGQDFSPNTINYTITGGDSSIRHTLLQKRDGRVYLCIWSEVSSFDFANRADVFPSLQNLEIQLNSIAASSVKIYENLSSEIMKVTAIGATNVINIGVNDQVVILEITPGNLADDNRRILTAGNGSVVDANTQTGAAVFNGASGLNLTAADFTVSTGGTITSASVTGDAAAVTVTFNVNTETGNAKTYNVCISPSSLLVRGGAIVTITQSGGAFGNTPYDCIAANWTVTFEGAGADCYAEFITNAPSGGGNAIKLERKAAVTSNKKLPSNFKLEFEFFIESKSGSANEMIWFGVLPTPAGGPNSLKPDHVSTQCYGFAPVFFYKKFTHYAVQTSNGYGFRANDFGDWELFNNTSVVGNGKNFETDKWHTVEINAFNGTYSLNLNDTEVMQFQGTANFLDQYLSFIVGSFENPSITKYIRNVRF